MGNLIFVAIAGLFAYKLWNCSGVNKLRWFFAGVLFFPQTIILLETPYMPFPRFLAFFLLLTFLVQDKVNLSIDQFPLRRVLFAVFGLFLLIGLFDQRLSLFLKIYRPIYFFVENLIILFLAFHYTRGLKEYIMLVKSLLSFGLILSLYGVINYVMGLSLYTKFIAITYNSIDFGNRYSEIGDARFRVSSFAWHPIYYGLVLALLIMITIMAFYSFKNSKTGRLYLLSMLFINLLWTNSRTPLLAAIAGLSLFYFYSVALNTKIRLFFVGVFLITIASIMSPSSFTIVEETLNTFTSKGSKLEGSSVEMRDMQLLASFAMFSEKPVFGHGFGFISEDLGYSSDTDKRTSDSDFAGFESYLYKILIEQGSAGIFATLLLFISLTRFFLKTDKKNTPFGKRLKFSSLGMILTFVLFIFGTGDLGGFTLFMSILGLNIKASQLVKTELDDKS
jgi:hypothetical protein